MAKKRPMIIGITGTLGAGKGTVVEYLVGKGFKHYSARSFITQEIERRGMPINRDTMIVVANDLRREHGPGYIIAELFKEAREAGGDAVIESIRTPGEVQRLRREENFSLWAVDADPLLRYGRIVGRGSETDSVPLEKFMEQEKAEMDSTDPNKQNIRAVIEQADAHLTNDGTLDELHRQIEEALHTFAV